MVNSTSGTIDTVCTIGSLENLIDQNQHGNAFLTGFIHFLYPQNFCIKRGDSLTYIIMYSHGGKQAHAGCRKGCCTYTGTGMHQYQIDTDGP